MKISKEIIIIIILFFAFSGKIWNFMWKIGMSLVYIIVIIFILNSINPKVGNKVKEMFSDFINLDLNTVKDIVANISKSGLSMLNKNKNINQENINQENINQENNIKQENIYEEYEDNQMIERTLNRNFINIGSNNNLRHLV
jgi:cell shape-determining protein MreC